MARTININGLSLCHKGSNGSATATLPDVCNTPGSGPVPFPNFAVSANLAMGTTSIQVEGGYMAAHRASEISISTGDEPGTLGGVKSGTFAKEATWLTFSFDVRLEGENACRLTDKLLMNHANTVCLGGWLDDWLAGPKGPTECAALLARILLIAGVDALGNAVAFVPHGQFKGLTQRIAEQVASGATAAGSAGAPMNRAPNAEWPRGSNPWMRHQAEIDRQQNSLIRHMDAYDEHCNNTPPPPAVVLELATQPLPVSTYVAPPAPTSSASAWDSVLNAGKWVVGGVVVVGAAAATVVLLADDATLVGVMDDWLIPFSVGAGAWGASLMGAVP